MGAEPPEPGQSVSGGMGEQKPAAFAVADATTKEEEAKQDAKLQPEREAGFKDYLVSTAPMSTPQAATDCTIASFWICSRMGPPPLCSRRSGGRGRRSRRSNSRDSIPAWELILFIQTLPLINIIFGK